MPSPGKPLRKLRGQMSCPLPTSSSGSSEEFRAAKDARHDDPAHHGTMEILPPPPMKSCLDRARNTLARTAVQIRICHWRSAEHLKRIRKRQDDKCWFCRKISCRSPLSQRTAEGGESRGVGGRRPRRRSRASCQS